MSDTGHGAAPQNNDEKSPEHILTRQIAKKLHALHTKRVSGAEVSWSDASADERKIWWSLAKSAVRLMKKNGYDKS